MEYVNANLAFVLLAKFVGDMEVYNWTFHRWNYQVDCKA